jgi:hypothetical protein
VKRIAEETVKDHVTRIFDKLRANDRTHAVTICLQRRIIELHTPPKVGYGGRSYEQLALITTSDTLPFANAGPVEGF